ncbi:MAG: DUF6069 family protein [Chloroflexota bacterium]
MSRNIWVNVGLTFLVSAVLNAIVYYAGLAFGVSYQTDDGPVTIILVVIASLFGAGLGSVGYWLLSLIFTRYRVLFIWLATIVGVISMAGPWFAASDLPTMGFLGLMHVVSVLVMTWYLGVWTPRYVTPESTIVAS